MPAQDYSDIIDTQKYMGCYARFYIHPSLNGDKTIEAKKNVYDDVLYVEICEKGNSKSSFSRPKNNEDEMIFPREWAEFKNNEAPSKGTGLNYLPNIGPAQQMNLNQQGIQSIEDLAALSDSVVSNGQGLFELRRRARAYMAAMQLEADEEVKEKRTRRKRNPETGELE